MVDRCSDPTGLSISPEIIPPCEATGFSEASQGEGTETTKVSAFEESKPRRFQEDEELYEEKPAIKESLRKKWQLRL